MSGDHLLRSSDRFVDLGDIREQLRPFYSDTGRPSVDPELMIGRAYGGCWLVGVNAPVEPESKLGRRDGNSRMAPSRRVEDGVRDGGGDVSHRNLPHPAASMTALDAVTLAG